MIFEQVSGEKRSAEVICAALPTSRAPLLPQKTIVDALHSKMLWSMRRSDP